MNNAALLDTINAQAVVDFLRARGVRLGMLPDEVRRRDSLIQPDEQSPSPTWGPSEGWWKECPAAQAKKSVPSKEGTERIYLTR